MWDSFNVIHLKQNHRQGEDWAYAEVLNRICTGSQSQEDITLLSSRITSRNDPDIPSDSMYIFARN